MTNYTWIGPDGGSWETPANWNPNNLSYPENPGDDATINSAGNVIIVNEQNLFSYLVNFSNLYIANTGADLIVEPGVTLGISNESSPDSENLGEITVESGIAGNSYADAELIISSDVFDNSGAIILESGNPGGDAEFRIDDDGPVSLEGGGSIEMTGAGLNFISGPEDQVSSLTNDVLVNVDNKIYGTGQIGLNLTFVNEGTIAASLTGSPGQVITFIQNPGFGFNNEGYIYALDSGTLVFGQYLSNDTFANTGTIAILGDNTSGLSTLEIRGDVTFTGNGFINLSNSTYTGNNVIEGSDANYSPTLNNNGNVISGTGDIENLTLINEGEIVAATSGGVLTLANDTTTNSGAMVAIDGGVLFISSAVTNSGAVAVALGGTVNVDAAMTNTGSGGVFIDANGNLNLRSAGSIIGNVTFAGLDATLRFNSSASQISGNIVGFAAGDFIDVTSLPFSSSVQAQWAENSADTAGTLTLSNGSTSTTFDLAGDYTLSYFGVSNDGNGGTLISLYPLNPVGTGDFNQPSADADMAFQSGDGTPVLWIMNGTTATEVTEANPGTSWVLSATGDFDSDGNADLAFQNVNGIPTIWLMNGTTVLTAMEVENTSGQVQNPTSSNHIVGSGDVFDTGFNNDILWQNNDGQPSIWQMNGTTVVNQYPLADPDQNANGTPNGAVWVMKGSGDFFDTGFNNDILFQNANGTPSIWQMNGATEVNAYALPNPTASFHIIGAGDFTGDGHNDSILFQNNDGQPAIWDMNATNVVSGMNIPMLNVIDSSGNVVPNPGPSWVITGIGNFNGASNGQSDIFWENTGSGQASVWIMNGNEEVSSAIVTPPITFQLSGESAYAPAAAIGTDLSSGLVATVQAPVLGINSHA